MHVHTRFGLHAAIGLQSASGELLGHVAGHVANVNLAHRNVKRSAVKRGRFGHARDGVLGSRVSDRAGARCVRRNRPVVDDATALWALVFHQLERVREAIKRAIEIHIHRPTPVFARQIAGHGGGQKDACVVEQQIQAAIVHTHLLKQFGHICLVAHIAGHGQCVACMCTGGLHSGLQRIRTTPHQHHLPTFGQQSQRACFANARTGACDDCYFAHLDAPV